MQWWLSGGLFSKGFWSSGRKKTEDAIATFNVDHKSSKVSHKFLRELLLFIRKGFKQLSYKITWNPFWTWKHTISLTKTKIWWMTQLCFMNLSKTTYSVMFSYQLLHKHWEYTEENDSLCCLSSLRQPFGKCWSRKRSMQSSVEARGENRTLPGRIRAL